MNVGDRSGRRQHWGEPAFFVYAPASVRLNGGYTNVSLDVSNIGAARWQKVLDSHSAINTSSSALLQFGNGRFYPPIPGFYDFEACITFSAAALMTRISGGIEFNNGASISAGYIGNGPLAPYVPTATATDARLHFGAKNVLCNTGDFLELWAYCAAGTSPQFVGGKYSTWWAGRFVAPLV